MGRILTAIEDDVATDRVGQGIQLPGRLRRRRARHAARRTEHPDRPAGDHVAARVADRLVRAVGARDVDGARRLLRLVERRHGSLGWPRRKRQGIEGMAGPLAGIRVKWASEPSSGKSIRTRSPVRYSRAPGSLPNGSGTNASAVVAGLRP